MTETTFTIWIQNIETHWRRRIRIGVFDTASNMGKDCIQEVQDLVVLRQGFRTDEERSGHPQKLTPSEYSENVWCTVWFRGLCGLFLEYLECGPVDEFIHEFDVNMGMETSNITWTLHWLCHIYTIINQSLFTETSNVKNILIGQWTWVSREDIGLWNGSYPKYVYIRKRYPWTRNSGIHSSRIFKRSAQEKNRTLRCLRIRDNCLGDIQSETPILWFLWFKNDKCIGCW